MSSIVRHVPRACQAKTRAKTPRGAERKPLTRRAPTETESRNTRSPAARPRFPTSGGRRGGIPAQRPETSPPSLRQLTISNAPTPREGAMTLAPPPRLDPSSCRRSSCSSPPSRSPRPSAGPTAADSTTRSGSPRSPGAPGQPGLLMPSLRPCLSLGMPCARATCLPLCVSDSARFVCLCFVRAGRSCTTASSRTPSAITSSSW